MIYDLTKYVTSAQAWYSVITWTRSLVNLTTVDSYSDLTYTLQKEIEIDKWWTYSVSFSLQRSAWTGWIVFARIYVNSVAVWIERSNWSWFITFTEDITISDWDLVQLYWYIEIWWLTWQVKDMEFKFDTRPNTLTYTINNA